MSLYLIILFALFCLINLYLIIKLAKSNRKQEQKAAMNCFGLFALFFIAKWLFSWYIPEYILILVMAALFVNNYFGYYKSKYNNAKSFDRALHAYGAFSFALFFYFIILLITMEKVSDLYRAIFIFFLGVGIGAIFELIEFAIDKKYKTTTQKSLKDTDTDMICNMIGSLVAALVSFFIIP